MNCNHAGDPQSYPHCPLNHWKNCHIQMHAVSIYQSIYLSISQSINLSIYLSIYLYYLDQNERPQSCMRLSGWHGCISRRNDLMEMSRAAVAPSKGWTPWYNVSHFTSVGMRDLLSFSSGPDQNLPLSEQKWHCHFLMGLQVFHCILICEKSIRAGVLFGGILNT